MPKFAHVISKEQAEDIRTREKRHREWLGDRTSYMPDEVPADARLTNDERSALEVYDFLNDPPDNYVFYIDRPTRTATTWTGEVLGAVSFGTQYNVPAFGGYPSTRVSISVTGINNRVYHGTWYKSSGDYARVKVAKRKGQVVIAQFPDQAVLDTLAAIKRT